jgi:hypothetical protein
MKKLLPVICFIFALSVMAESTWENDDPIVTSAVMTILCDFPYYVSQTEINKNQNFSIKFNYDIASHKAFMIGNLGLSEVIPISGSEALTFLEILDNGVVQTTTLDRTTLDMYTNKEQSLDAVHSRHTILFGLFPSQAYGKCKIILPK